MAQFILVASEGDEDSWVNLDHVVRAEVIGGAIRLYDLNGKSAEITGEEEKSFFRKQTFPNPKRRKPSKAVPPGSVADEDSSDE